MLLNEKERICIDVYVIFYMMMFDVRHAHFDRFCHISMSQLKIAVADDDIDYL